MDLILGGGGGQGGGRNENLHERDCDLPMSL